MSKVIDSHIHLDFYKPRQLEKIIYDLATYDVDALITVSAHFDSSVKNLTLSKAHDAIKPAFGYHPEQTLPTEEEIEQLIRLMNTNKDQMVAVGEVGLPYYTRKKQPHIQLEPYIELLEPFMKQAQVLNKPIVLHAVYEDASLVCDLLEKHSIEKAHFHWFKGDLKTIERMIENGYYISLTPDVLYEKEIRQLTKLYPLTNLMIETDGPWPFQGPFQDHLTHPKMLHRIVSEVATIKKVRLQEVYDIIYENTKRFYRV